MRVLNTKLQGHYEAEYTIQYFTKRSKSSAEDIITAINLFLELTTSPETIEKYIHYTYIMCRYMSPSVEDIVSMLLWLPCSRGRASYRLFQEKFRADRFEFFYNQTVDALKSTPKTTEMEKEDATNYHVYMRVCDKMLDGVIASLEKRGIPDTYCIWKAYSLARKAHYGVYRKSGEPYLTHPIAVASILADMGIESHIVAAALLHDVDEDTDYRLNDISTECGEQIARYVNAVTSLHRAYANSHNNSEYSLDKNELDAKSFEKLVQIVHSDPRMVFALYIKAADRIHNLSTIDIMASEKQHDKTDETELDYLPLFREFKLNYFVGWIEDLTWKIANPQEYKEYEENYENLYSKNQAHIDDMKKTLVANLSDDFNHFCTDMCDIAGFDCSITRRYYRPLEIRQFVRTAVGPTAVSSRMIDKRTVPTCDFDVILDGRDDKSDIDAFATMFVKMFGEHISPTGREMVDFETDDYDRFIVKIEDRYRNNYRVCFCMRDAYVAYNLGSNKGVYKEQETAAEQPKGDTIFVKLRNGKPVEMPKDSTALDLAFMIHEEIGLSAKGVKINDRFARISSILHDGDKVVIDADTERRDGRVTKLVIHARINWLTFVKTKHARNKIARYLESQYEGDSSVSALPDETSENSSGDLWETNKAAAKNLFPEDS